MICLFRALFCGHAREAWSHYNLQPVAYGLRINWELYAEICQARNLMGPAEMQQRRFNQLISHNAKSVSAL